MKQNANQRLAREAAGIHPVVIHTFKRLVPGPSGERYALDQTMVNGLFTVLVTSDKKQRPHVAQGLRAMANVARKQWGCPTLADQLRLLLHHPKVVAALEETGVMANAQTTARIERMIGAGLEKTARKLGAKKPAGTLSMDQLGYPKRL